MSSVLLLENCTCGSVEPRDMREKTRRDNSTDVGQDQSLTVSSKEKFVRKNDF